jgi:hypothetical protein
MRLSPRLLLSVSAVAMLLVATLHTVGNLQPPGDPSLSALFATMRGFRYNLGMGMNPSMFDVHMLLVLTMTVTFVGLGVLNLMLARARDISDGLLRRIIWINFLWVGASIALSWFYRVPPPLISGIIIELPLIGALVAGNSTKS